jgi:hypothetical protein
MKKSPALFVAVGFSAGLVIALPVALSLWRFAGLRIWVAAGCSILFAKGVVLTWFYWSPYSREVLFRKIMLSLAVGPVCLGVGAIFYDFNRALSLSLVAVGLVLHFVVMHVWRTRLRRAAGVSPERPGR